MLLLNQLAKKDSCWKKALLFLLSKVRHLHPPRKKKLVYLNHRLCARMDVWVYSSMCTCMEIESRCWMSSSVIVHFSFWDLGFNKPGAFCSSWSLSSWDLPACLHAPSDGLQMHVPIPSWPACLRPPAMGCRCMLPSPAFTWVLGIWSSPCLCIRHLTHCAVSPGSRP